MIEHLDGIFETVTFRENLRMRISDMSICENFPDHWHTPMEIIHAKENWYRIVVDDQTYQLKEGILPSSVLVPYMRFTRRRRAAGPSIWRIYHF